MGKFEKPLTWILVIGILGYLFMGNYGKTECSTEVKKEIRVENEDLNIDSMVYTVIENIDLEGDIDTVIEINIDLDGEEETTEE